jgi:hypothetical protein
VDDPEAQMNLAKHLAGEVRHAWLWAEFEEYERSLGVA